MGPRVDGGVAAISHMIDRESRAQNETAARPGRSGEIDNKNRKVENMEYENRKIENSKSHFLFSYFLFPIFPFSIFYFAIVYFPGSAGRPAGPGRRSFLSL